MDQYDHGPLWPGRSVIGPIVFFQLYASWRVFPSRKLPPGIRRKVGCMSTIILMRFWTMPALGSRGRWERKG